MDKRRDRTNDRLPSGKERFEVRVKVQMFVLFELPHVEREDLTNVWGRERPWLGCLAEKEHGNPRSVYVSRDEFGVDSWVVVSVRWTIFLRDERHTYT